MPSTPTPRYAGTPLNPEGRPSHHLFLLDARPTSSKSLAAEGLQQVWLPAFDRECREAELLLRMFDRRKASPERDALWSGYWALQQTAKETAENIRKRGGLLFAWEGSTALTGGAA